MISPSDVGLPSLPAVDRSATGVVNESENRGCFDAVALIRGALQAETGAFPAAGAEEASDGKATSELVSGLEGT